MHHYLLRDWLEAGGVDLDRVRFCVLPPTQMTRQLEMGKLDGFCAGEPWNTVAEQQGAGPDRCRRQRKSCRIIPEKVVAVSRRWLAKSGAAAESLIRATLRGCAFCCETPTISRHLAEMLAKSRRISICRRRSFCTGACELTAGSADHRERPRDRFATARLP